VRGDALFQLRLLVFQLPKHCHNRSTLSGFRQRHVFCGFFQLTPKCREFRTVGFQLPLVRVFPLFGSGQFVEPRLQLGKRGRVQQPLPETGEGEPRRRLALNHVVATALCLGTLVQAAPVAPLLALCIAVQQSPAVEVEDPPSQRIGGLAVGAGLPLQVPPALLSSELAVATHAGHNTSIRTGVSSEASTTSGFHSPSSFSGAPLLKQRRFLVTANSRYSTLDGISQTVESIAGRVVWVEARRELGGQGYGHRPVDQW
jgi:hypothetical protein